jgi:hypothetical protein
MGFLLQKTLSQSEKCITNSGRVQVHGETRVPGKIGSVPDPKPSLRRGLMRSACGRQVDVSPRPCLRGAIPCIGVTCQEHQPPTRRGCRRRHRWGRGRQRIASVRHGGASLRAGPGAHRGRRPRRHTAERRPHAEAARPPVLSAGSRQIVPIPIWLRPWLQTSSSAISV